MPLLSFLVYCNTLGAGFVYDDRPSIIENEDVVSTSGWNGLFSNDFWGIPLTHLGSHKSYRPICTLTFRMNHLLHGHHPMGYHLLNVLCHCLCSFLFTRLCLAILRDAFPVAVSGLLFSVHPIHTEAVAGIVGRADLLSALFFTSSFLLYREHVRRRMRPPAAVASSHHPDTVSASVSKVNPRLDHRNGSSCSSPSPSSGTASRWACLIASSACGVLSTLSKENGVTVLLVCIVYDVFLSYGRDSGLLRAQAKTNHGRRLKESVSTVAVVLCFTLLFRMRMLEYRLPSFSASDNPASKCDNLLVRTLTFLYLPVFNFLLLVYPKWLSFDWSMEVVPLVKTFRDPRILWMTFFYGLFLYLCRMPIEVRHGVRRLAGPAAARGGCGHDRRRASEPNELLADRHGAVLSPDGRRLPSPALHLQETHGGGEGLQISPSTTLFPTRGDFADELPLGADEGEALLVALLFLVLPFLPASNLFFYVGFTIAERLLYIPSMGYCLLVGLGARRMLKRTDASPPLRRLLYALTGVSLLFLTLKTVQRNGEWKDEESLYQSAVKLDHPKALGNLGVVFSLQRREKEAEWAYRQALLRRPNMADVHYNLGLLLHQRGVLEEALNSYAKAIDLRPTLTHAYAAMGRLLLETKQERLGELFLRRCLDLDISGVKDRRAHERAKASAAHALASMHFKERNYDKAVLVVQRTETAAEAVSPEAQELFLLAGESYSALGDAEKAEQWYKRALDVRPDHLSTCLTYGRWLSKNLSRSEEAEKFFHRLEATFPGEASVYHQHGHLLYELLRFDEAVVKYLRAVSLTPSDASLLFNAANALREVGRREEALLFYRRALHLHPGDASIYLNLGATLHLSGNLPEAEVHYLKALSLRPHDKTALVNLRSLRQRQGGGGGDGARRSTRNASLSSSRKNFLH